MINFDDTVLLDITEDDIKSILKEIISKDFYKRDNLRDRHPNVQFDCLLRGYIGEVGIKKWFESYGIFFDNSSYTYDDEGNIDIDLLYSYHDKKKTLEIKTSLVPDFCAKDIKDDKKRIEKVINLFDIKLIRRNSQIIEELKGDIHLQIYYAHLRGKKDEFLKNIDFSIDINHIDDITTFIDSVIDVIYDSMQLKEYIKRSYFVGWIDKESLIKSIKLKEKDKRIWSFKGSKREFWSCQISSEAKKPIELIEYLKSLK